MPHGIEDWEQLWLLREPFRQANDAELGFELYCEMSYAFDIPGNIVDRFRYETDDPGLVLNQRAKVARLIEQIKPNRAE